MTNDTDLIRENRKLIESKLDEIEDDTWTVVDFDPELDPHEPRTVQVTLLYEESAEKVIVDGTDDGDVNNFKSVVKTVDSNHPHEPGAPLPAIKERAADELDWDHDTTDDTLEEMRTKGHLYSPSGDQYKVV